MKLVMDERLKHRLVGIAVILSIGAIFAPAMMKKSNQHFGDKNNISIKLPPPPLLPKVAMPNKETVFKTVKVAHVNIPSVKTNSVLPIMAKAKPSTSGNTQKIAAIASHELAFANIDLGKSNGASTSLKLKPQETIVLSDQAPPFVKKTLPASKLTPPSKGMYAVQLATFAEQQNAISLVKKLKNQGFIASFNKINGKHGPIYKVLVGKVYEKQQAQALQQKLVGLVQLKGFVVATGIS